MPTVITLSGDIAGNGHGRRTRGLDAAGCKWTKQNKRTGCSAQICNTGKGKSGWQIVQNVCARRGRKTKRRGR